jgi:hypothetical protein
MDCEQVKDLLDAYALGAAEADEAAGLEEHMADCVRCWPSFDEAQRAAAAIALSVTLQRAPDSLRRGILADIERAQSPERPSLRERLRGLRPVGAGLLVATAAASLAFAIFLQAEVSDLRDENDQLEAEIVSAEARFTQQQQVMDILAAPDSQEIRLEPTDPTSSATAVYYWSNSAKSGALLCSDLPALSEGEMYEVWLLTDSGSYKAGSFEYLDDIGHLIMAPGAIPELPITIGVSIESAEGASEPGEMFLQAEFQR